MSQESSSWLNTMTLIGFTAERGMAWHYRAEEQGNESNHYVAAVPVDDVLRRLFNFDVVEAPVYYLANAADVESLGALPRFIPSQSGRKGMLTSDTQFDLGAFKDGYRGHAYSEWLLDSVAAILDDDLAIGSAGLLRNRAQAWVSVEMPENVRTPEGIEFRPYLLAATSFDGSLATTIGRKFQLTVCDNTLSMALRETGQSVKIRHSRNSGLRITDAREALAIVHTMGEEFAAELAELSAWRVGETEFERHLAAMVPMPDEKGRGRTLAESKREQIVTLYRHDDRAAPWRGTALGVLQAHNTWNHHYMTVRGDVARGMRNMENVIVGKTATQDADCLRILAEIAPRETAPDSLIAV